MGVPWVLVLGRRLPQDAAVSWLMSVGRLGSWALSEAEGRWALSPSLLALQLLALTAIWLGLYHNLSQSSALAQLFRTKPVYLILLFSSCLHHLFTIHCQVIHQDELCSFLNSLRPGEEMLPLIGSIDSPIPGPPMAYFICNTLALILGGLVHIFLIGDISFFFHTYGLAFVMEMDIFVVSVFINCIYVQLSHLNKYLVSVIKGNEMVQLNEDSLEFYCKRYSKLCSQADRMNDTFGPQLTLDLSFCFGILILGLYNIVGNTVFTSGPVPLPLCAIYLSLAFHGFCTFLTVTRTCVDTVNKAKEFNMLLYQVVIDDKTNHLPKNNKLRLHIAMNREVVFTACGFFTLDNALVHSVLAAASTYLVILIQFGQPVPSTTPATTPIPTTAYLNVTTSI